MPYVPVPLGTSLCRPCAATPGVPHCRPINRILLAQRITLPQMWVSVLVMVLHAGANWLLIYHLQWGYLGAAWATSLVRA